MSALFCRWRRLIADVLRFLIVKPGVASVDEVHAGGHGHGYASFEGFLTGRGNNAPWRRFVLHLWWWGWEE